MYLGIEIGGTKLQLGVGPGDGMLAKLWRGTVEVSRGAVGIREQIVVAARELGEFRGVGVGFGGPVDDKTRSVITSHQIEGWDNFPLADWLTETLGVPAVLGNDADVAGLAEATFGAGRGLSPVLYMTIGSGIGGGLIIDGNILRGVGRGAAEIGHLRPEGGETLEHLASGWGIGHLASEWTGQPTTAVQVATAARAGETWAIQVMDRVLDALADAICAAIVFVCPARVVIGGGVSLMGDDLFFQPLRSKVAERVFKPFAGLTDIVPAALGEEVVVHGAVALAARSLR